MLHVAFHWAVHGSLEKRQCIVLHFHGYEYGGHDLALNDFPSLKYIATFRDLREHISGYKQNKIPKRSMPQMQETRDLFFAYYAFQWHYFARNLFRFIQIYDDKNVLFVDLQTMHKSPQLIKS